MQTWYGQTCSATQIHYHQFLRLVFGPGAENELEKYWHHAPVKGAPSMSLDSTPRFMLTRNDNGQWACPFCAEPFEERDTVLLKHIRACEAADAVPLHRVRFSDRLWWRCFGVLPPVRYWIELTTEGFSGMDDAPPGRIAPDERRIYLDARLPQPELYDVAIAAQRQLKSAPAQRAVELVWPTGRPVVSIG